MTRVLPGILLFSAFALACGDSSGPPTMASLAGTYSASQFTVAETGADPVDFLALGATISLTLNADGTTAGQLHVPDGGEEGGDFTASLVGTWTQIGEVVSLDHPADTFLRDMNFAVDGNTLSGSATFSGTTVTVRLRR